MSFDGRTREMKLSNASTKFNTFVRMCVQHIRKNVLHPCQLNNDKDIYKQWPYTHMIWLKMHIRCIKRINNRISM